METVIYVAVALVAGVAVGKFLLAPQPTLCQIRIPLVPAGNPTSLGDIYVSASARETVLWTGGAATVSGFSFGLNSTQNLHPQAAIVGRDLDSKALSTTAQEKDKSEYRITAGAQTYNGRIIIQK